MPRQWLLARKNLDQYDTPLLKGDTPALAEQIAANKGIESY